MAHGVVAWFTGLPASGKSTLARAVRARLADRPILLDSDELRDVLGTHGYTPAERDAQYRVLGRLAAMLAAQGHDVLVAATAPRRAHRDAVRASVPRFAEVYVATPLAACEARDPKQLYARARVGDAPDLPGVGADYQPPHSPEVTARDGRDDDAAAAIPQLIARR